MQSVDQSRSVNNIRKCVVCLRPTDRLSKESSCQQQKIADVYLTYVKPKLSTTTSGSVNWASLQKRSTFYYSQFCSDCHTAGQKLTSMNNRLKALQCAIDDFVNSLAIEIAKYRDEVEPSSYSPSDVFPETELQSVEEKIKKENADIKEEVDNDVVYIEYEEPHDFLEDQIDDLIAVEEDFLNPVISEQDESYIDSSETERVTNETDPLSVVETEITNSREVKDILTNVQSRKLVVSLRRLEDEPLVSKRTKRSPVSRIGPNNRNTVSKNRPTLRKNLKIKEATNARRTRRRKQNFKRIFDELDVDYDIDGNEIKSEEKVKEYKFDSDEEAEEAIEQQIKKKIASKRSTLNEHNTTIKNQECILCGETFNSLLKFQVHMFKIHRRFPEKCTKCGDLFIDRESRRRHEKSVHPHNKSMQCDSCPDLGKFQSVYEFEIHVMTHTGEIPYSCPKCNKQFSNARNYSEHQKSSSCANSDGEFACTEAKCNSTFKAKCLLLAHITVFHKGKKKEYSIKKCDICGVQLMHKFSVEDHYAKHTEEFIIPCDICGVSLLNCFVLDRHRKTHLGGRLPCDLCDKNFSNDRALKFHFNKKHSTEAEMNRKSIKMEIWKEYTCERCGKKWPGRAAYNKHSKLCHKKFFCEICGKAWATPSVLRAHLKIHEEGIPTCTICNKQFANYNSRKAHMDEIHYKKSQVICEQCGKACRDSKSLAVHVKVHHSDVPCFDCKFCGEKFRTRHKLYTHNQIAHVGEPIPCPYCSEMFPTKSQQRSHEDRLHWEVRNKDFKCTACDAIFKQRIQCARHRKLMHRELIITTAPKTCELCHRTLHNNYALQNHMRRHERDKHGSFQCQLCQRTFMKQQSLTWHLSQDHQIMKGT